LLLPGLRPVRGDIYLRSHCFGPIAATLTCMPGSRADHDVDGKLGYGLGLLLIVRWRRGRERRLVAVALVGTVLADRHRLSHRLRLSAASFLVGAGAVGGASAGAVCIALAPEATRGKVVATSWGLLAASCWRGRSRASSRQLSEGAVFAISAC